MDESYFGGARKGQRGRGAAGKVPVFGLLKRGGRVYAAVMPDCGATTLLPIIHEHVTPDSMIYSDSWPVYNALQAFMDQSEPVVCARQEPHQRNREFLEPGQTTPTQVQWCAKAELLPVFEGMRVAF